jgi:DNA-binding winged helix-turn-helix (wHTH) protein
MARRTQTSEHHKHPDVRLCAGLERALLNDQDLRLSRQVRQVLRVLADPPGKLVNRAEIERRVGSNVLGQGGANLRNVINKLRDALQRAQPGGRSLIQSTARLGWLLALEKWQVRLTDTWEHAAIEALRVEFVRKDVQEGPLIEAGLLMTVVFETQIEPPLRPIVDQKVEWKVMVHGKAVEVQLIPPPFFARAYPTWVQYFLNGGEVHCRVTLSSAAQLEPAVAKIQGRLRERVLKLARPLLPDRRSR